MSRLREDQPIEALRGLAADAEAFKAAQFVGPDSLIGYLTGLVPELFDISFSIGANQTRRFILNFEFMTAQDGAIIDLFPFYSLNDPNVAASAYPPWYNGPPVSMFVQQLPPEKKRARWYFQFVNSGGNSWTVYTRWIFSGTDEGVWSLEWV